MSRPSAPGFGRVVAGILLLVAGLGWLLAATEVIDFPARAVVPIALIVVGVALLWRSRTGSHPGLILLGLCLVAFLTVAEAIVPFDADSAGIGERSITPTTAAALSDSYGLTVGQFTLDLSELPLRRPASTRVRVGIGELRVIVPESLTVRGTAESGIGEVVVFDHQEGGFGVEQDIDQDGSGRRPVTLRLELSVGIGRIEVRSAPGRARNGEQDVFEDRIQDGARRALARGGRS